MNYLPAIQGKTKYFKPLSVLPKRATSPVVSGISRAISPPASVAILRITTPSEYRLQILTADHGRLPSDHPRIIYLKELCKKVNPDFTGEIHVLPNHPDVNAFVAEDGKAIFLTQRLLNMLHYEEELASVLSHEIIHIQNGHSEQRAKAKGGVLGLGRRQEMEADFEGAKAMDEAEINPLGAVSALQTLHQKSGGAGIQHGASQDRALNLLLTIPLADLPNLNHNLTPLPRFLKTTGFSPPLSKRAREMPFEQLKRIVNSANIYQLRVMLVGINSALWEQKQIDSKGKKQWLMIQKLAESEINELQRRQALLLQRAEEFFGRLLIKKGHDPKFKRVCLGFYLDLLKREFFKLEFELDNSYSTEEIAWLAENFVSVFLNGETGLSPLQEEGAFSYCYLFAKFSFRHFLAQDIQEYKRHRIDLCREMCNKLTKAETKNEAEVCLEQIFKESDMPMSPYVKEEKSALLDCFDRRPSTSGHKFWGWEMGLRNRIYLCRFFAIIAFRSFKKDIREYLEWNTTIGRKIHEKVQVDSDLLDRAIHILLDSTRFDIIEDGKRQGHEFVWAVVEALENMRDGADVSMDLLEKLHALMHNRHVFDLSRRDRGPIDKSISKRFKPIIEEVIGKHYSSHLPQNVMELAKQLILGYPSRRINLSVVSATDLEALFELFLSLKYFPKGVSFGFYGHSEPPKVYHYEDRLRQIYNIIERLNKKESAEKLKVAFGFDLFNEDIGQVLGPLDRRKDDFDKKFEVRLEDLARLERIYREAAREALNTFSKIHPTVDLSQEEVNAIVDDVQLEGKRYRYLVLTSLKKLLLKEGGLEDRLEGLAQLPSLFSGKWFSDITLEEENFFRRYVIQNGSKARFFDHKLILTFLIPNRAEREMLQCGLVLAQVKKLTFEETLILLEKLGYLGKRVLYPAMKYMCEALPATMEEHEQALEYTKKKMGDWNPEDLQMLAFIDTASYYWFPWQMGILKAGLASATDERYFKGFLFDKWMYQWDVKEKDIKETGRSFIPPLLRFDHHHLYYDCEKMPYEVFRRFPFENPLSYPYKFTGREGGFLRDRPFLRGGLTERPQPFSSIVDWLYSLDAPAKEALLRKCLIARDGVLTGTSSRHELINYFLEQRLVKDGQADLAQIIAEGLGAFTETGSPEEIYQYFGPFLRESFLVPPIESYPYHLLAEEKAAAAFDRAKQSFVEEQWGRESMYLPGGSVFVEDEQPRAQYKQIEKEREREIEGWVEQQRKELVEQASQQILNAIVGEAVEKSKYEILLSDRARLQQMFGISKRGNRPALAPIELIIQAGNVIGPAGDRFLQLLGQYIEIPADYQEVFDKVYDSRPGQPRFSAYSTLKREANRDGLNGRYFGQLKIMGKRIGGGSLVSVYETEMENGEKGVLKITNPNALYRTEEAMQIIKKVVDFMEERHPEQAATYAAIRMLFEDIGEWIMRDVRDERFYENDWAYYKYNGYSNGGDYRIRIPKHRKLSGPYLRAEQFIEGRNLTKVRIKGKEKAKKDCLMVSEKEYKEIVCLLAQTYLMGILDGLALSDVSPGNVRITKERDVALLDRNFYLELEPNDISLVKDLLASFDSPLRVAQIISSYLVALPQNKPLTGQQEVVEQKIREALISRNGSKEECIFKVLVAVKEQGFRVPLEISLLIKNIRVLNNLAQKAGFGSLLECLLFRKNQELLMQLNS